MKNFVKVRNTKGEMMWINMDNVAYFIFKDDGTCVINDNQQTKEIVPIMDYLMLAEDDLL